MRLLVSAAAEAYSAARTAAQAGRFAEARLHLAPVLDLPTDENDPLCRLDRLCAVALGASPDPCEDYTSAYAAASRGDFAAAVSLARRCVEAAPGLLAAQKLLLLALAATGQETEAERSRAELAALLPGDPDFIRWRFVEPAPIPAPPAPRRAAETSRVRRPVPAPRRRPAVPAVVTAPEPPPRRRSLWNSPLVPLVASGAALVVASVALVRGPSPTLPTERPMPPPASPRPTAVSTALLGTPGAKNPSDKNTDIASDLKAEATAQRREADFALARSWFNRAVRAKRSGDWRTCDRLAAGAYALASETYLGDEALLLRAQAAENLGDSLEAAERYAKIAEAKPDSAYAAWALRRAANLEERKGQSEKAGIYRDILRKRYPTLGTGTVTSGLTKQEKRVSSGNPT